ncbi:LysR substrate-binding domain-containing protein [Pseudomonadota bacterium]
MISSRLPPLRSLLAFEATVRLGTLTKASEELSVTHSAISQNIKQLEDFLGHDLFVRSGRRLVATKSALNYLQELRPSLNRISDATQAFKSSERPNNISLKMVSSLALRWFIPKIPQLQEVHPDLKLRLVMEAVSDVENLGDEIDAAIGFGHESEFNGLCSLQLCESKLVLVGLAPLKKDMQQVLESYPAIYIETPRRSNDWSLWCKQLGLAEPKVARRIVLLNSAQALEAVSAGVGVLVTQHIFVEPLIALDHFVSIGDTVSDPAQGYYFYCNESQMKRPAIKSLYSWLANLV